MKILGISYGYHDSAACLIDGPAILGASQEERFSRRKHDPAFPVNSIRYVLSDAGLSLAELDGIVYYEDGNLKFQRQLKSLTDSFPRGLKYGLVGIGKACRRLILSSDDVIRHFLEENLISKSDVDLLKTKVFVGEHHLSHAASAFFPSPFKNALVVCLDAVGESVSSSVWLGDGSNLNLVAEDHYPNSLGLFYSAFTYYCGFKVNSGEYKLMGLAPYGKPRYKSKITELLDVRDGKILINLRYFQYTYSDRMIGRELEQFLGAPRRDEKEDISEYYCDVAASVQEVLNEAVVTFISHYQDLHRQENLCLAGGVALNCVSNSYIAKSGLFRGNIWVQPAAGDAGGAIGAAYSLLYSNQIARTPIDNAMRGALLGPQFSTDAVRICLQRANLEYSTYEDDELHDVISQALALGNIVGIFRGRAEFGPRALGNRSIIADPRVDSMQKTLNLKVKFREGFRPFAPAVLKEYAPEYFEGCDESPFMLFTFPVTAEKRRYGPVDFDDNTSDPLRRLYHSRSEIQAVTHLDYSARVQTVDREINPRFYDLIDCFYRITNCPLIINTSFNVRGEPIVGSPNDAINCFLSTEIDILVMENFVVLKSENDRIKAERLQFPPD